MRTWLALLGGMLLWAAHFFGLYLIAEFGGEGSFARLAGAALTMVCLAGAVMLALRLRRCVRWVRAIGYTGALLGFVAILWQALPLILVWRP